MAACKLTREEALQQSEDFMSQTGLSDYSLQFIEAHGRIEKYSPCYQVCLLQRFNGKPIYWSGTSRRPQLESTMPSNDVSLVWDDSGLVYVKGYWSTFVPTCDDRPIIDETAAANALIVIGEAPQQLESCYLMQFDGVSATATPANRYQNRFVNAFTGEVMQ